MAYNNLDAGSFETFDVTRVSLVICQEQVYARWARKKESAFPFQFGVIREDAHFFSERDNALFEVGLAGVDLTWAPLAVDTVDTNEEPMHIIPLNGLFGKDANV